MAMAGHRMHKCDLRQVIDLSTAQPLSTTRTCQIDYTDSLANRNSVEEIDTRTVHGLHGASIGVMTKDDEISSQAVSGGHP